MALERGKAERPVRLALAAAALLAAAAAGCSFRYKGKHTEIRSGARRPADGRGRKVITAAAGGTQPWRGG